MQTPGLIIVIAAVAVAMFAAGMIGEWFAAKTVQTASTTMIAMSDLLFGGGIAVVGQSTVSGGGWSRIQGRGRLKRRRLGCEDAASVIDLLRFTHSDVLISSEIILR